jgi:hypothetical protein
MVLITLESIVYIACNTIIVTLEHNQHYYVTNSRTVTRRQHFQVALVKPSKKRAAPVKSTKRSHKKQKTAAATNTSAASSSSVSTTNSKRISSNKSSSSSSSFNNSDSNSKSNSTSTTKQHIAVLERACLQKADLDSIRRQGADKICANSIATHFGLNVDIVAAALYTPGATTSAYQLFCAAQRVIDPVKFAGLSKVE